MLFPSGAAAPAASVLPRFAVHGPVVVVGNIRMFIDTSNEVTLNHLYKLKKTVRFCPKERTFSRQEQIGSLKSFTNSQFTGHQTKDSLIGQIKSRKTSKEEKHTIGT